MSRVVLELRVLGWSPSPALYNCEAFERCSLTLLSLCCFNMRIEDLGLFSKLPESNPSAGTVSSTCKIYQGSAHFCPYPWLTIWFKPPDLPTGFLQWAPTWPPRLHSALSTNHYSKAKISKPSSDFPLHSYYNPNHEALLRLAAASSLPPASTFLLLVISPGQPHLISFCSGDQQPCLASGPLLLLFLVAGAPSPLIWLLQVLPRESVLKIVPPPWPSSIILLVLFSL